MPARTWARYYHVYLNAQFLSWSVWWGCGGAIRTCYIMIPTCENKYSNPTNNCPWSFPLTAWPWSREQENSCQSQCYNIDITSSLQCNDQAHDQTEVWHWSSGRCHLSDVSNQFVFSLNCHQHGKVLSNAGTWESTIVIISNASLTIENNPQW